MIQEGVEEWEETGFGAGRPLLRGMLADACLLAANTSERGSNWRWR